MEERKIEQAEREEEEEELMDVGLGNLAEALVHKNWRN